MTVPVRKGPACQVFVTEHPTRDGYVPALTNGRAGGSVLVDTSRMGLSEAEAGRRGRWYAHDIETLLGALALTPVPRRHPTLADVPHTCHQGRPCERCDYEEAVHAVASEVA